MPRCLSYLPVVSKSRERGERTDQHEIEFRRTSDGTADGIRYSSMVIGELTTKDLKALQAELNAYLGTETP